MIKKGDLVIYNKNLAEVLEVYNCTRDFLFRSFNDARTTYRVSDVAFHNDRENGLAKTGDLVYLNTTENWIINYISPDAVSLTSEIGRAITLLYGNRYDQLEQIDKLRDCEVKKETNPKDSVAVDKVPFFVLSGAFLTELALAMAEGALKYGAHNYREAGVKHTVYTSAILRHLLALMEGENIDPDSQLSHWTKIASCCHVARDAELRGMMTDDRPTGTKGFIQWANNFYKTVLRKKYPKAAESFTATREPDSYNPVEKGLSSEGKEVKKVIEKLINE